jgi:hypothetical protein
VTASAAFSPFRVDADAFDSWITLRGDTLEYDVPVPGRGARPAAALSELVEEAVALGPIVGDHRLELQVIAADDQPGPGYVLIVRPRGQPDLPGITAGWIDLAYVDAADDMRAAAWTYLTTLCDQANDLLNDPRKVLP